MPLAWYVLVLVALYLARWSVNPLRSRVPALRRVLARPLPSRYAGDSLLEIVLGAGRPAGSSAADDDDTPRWELQWHLLGFLVTTTALNELPARFVLSLAPRQTRSLTRFYDIALIWAALGLALCVALLLWEALGTTVWLWSTLREGALSVEPQAALGPRVKRSLVPSTRRTDSSSLGGAVIHPLIPGVTLPWSHAPMLVAAFLLGQLVHEPGHAITGALSGLSTLAASLHLSPIFPSASVVLPSLALKTLPPREKARIAVAGCWHNLLFASALWTTCALLNSTQRNVSGVGRVVLHVDSSSPLSEVLPVGALLTHLDDQPLGVRQADGPPPVDPWTTYLTSSDITSKGWCLDRASFEAQPSDCCVGGTTSSELHPTLCFRSTAFKDVSGHCMLPDILTSVPAGRAASDRCPCASDSDVCVNVDRREEVLRVGFVEEGRPMDEPSWLLWQGARQQILIQVITSDRRPPVLLPTSLYPAYLYLSALKNYVVMISFTLATLNLLPFPFLDGGLCFSSFLEWAFPDKADPTGDGSQSLLSTSGDLDEEVEDGLGGDRPTARWRNRVEIGVAWGTGGLGVWVLGGIVLRLALNGYG